MITIHLHEIIVFAHHGIYDEEKISGNKFEVNLDVSFDSKKNKFDSIKDTVDYEILNVIVKECMKVPTPLLEKVCGMIIKKVKNHYPFIAEINISVFKLQPPIKDFSGRAGVSIRKIFS
ncbi:MAG TPA: dihydroneopterin aldolase [Puia sp.]|nr:dihydroneopterin aldolase [Puia sp.]